MVHAIDYSGCSVVHQPLERHPFEGAGYLCTICDRPRALHLQDGFRPRPGWGPETLSSDPKATYRSHPYHYRGRIKLTKAEEAELARFKH